jgi:hypothetical protein
MIVQNFSSVIKKKNNNPNTHYIVKNPNLIKTG